MEKPKHNEAIDFSDICVTIATPCYGDAVSSRYVDALAYTIPVLLANKIKYNIMQIPNDSIIQTARNRLVDQFLKSNGTHLWFIDADMGWKAEDVLRLFASKRLLVGAAGMRKQEKVSYCALMENPATWCAETGMVKAISVGTGCVVIAREVFEKIQEADPENWYFDNGNNENKIYNFFEHKIYKHNFWTEDYTFCNKWRKVGGEVWIDPGFYLEHVGKKVWAGKLSEALKPISDYFIHPELLDTGE